MVKIAILGAGAAGLTCGHQLRRAGVESVIFEKSRGLGGRMSTRRVTLDDHELRFDHGAQFVRAKSELFASALENLDAHGTAHRWQPVSVTGAEQSSVAPDQRPFWVGHGGMKTMFSPYADGLDIRFETLVDSVTFDDGPRVNGLPFDAVISTIPAPQASALFCGVDDFEERLRTVEVAPCWALLLAFEQPLSVPFDTWRHVNDDIGWLARNSSKPGAGASTGADCWVLHASPAWSRTHLELDKEAVAPRLLQAFKSAVGLPDATPIYAAAHRWRYSQTITPLGAPFLKNTDQTVFVGGDWALGGRVEAAFQSGKAMAEASLAALG